MVRLLLIGSVAVAILACCGGLAQAKPIVSDDFSYADGVLAGNSGGDSGTGSSWTSGWEDTGWYSSWNVSNGKATTPNGAAYDHFQNSRSLTTDFSGATPLYFSACFRLSEDAATGFLPHDGTCVALMNWTTESTAYIGIRSYGPQMQPYVLVERNESDLQIAGTYTAGTDMQLVGKIDFNVDGTDNERIQMWANPTSYEKSTQYSSVITMDLEFTAPETVFMGSFIESGAASIDNLKIGTTWLDVGPGILGDANGDGVVDGSDLSVMSSHWLDTGMSWGDGDFSGDGVVDGSDLSIMSSHWLEGVESGEGMSFGNALAAAGFNPVPEPGTIALLTMAAAGLGLCAWRRRKFNTRSSQPTGGNMKLKVVLLCVGLMASMCAAVRAEAIGEWSMENEGAYDRWVLTVTPDAGVTMIGFDIKVEGSDLITNGNAFNGETKDLHTDFLLQKTHFDGAPVTDLNTVEEWAYPSVLAANFSRTTNDGAVYAPGWSSAVQLLEVIVDTGTVTDPYTQLSVGSQSYSGQPAHYFHNDQYSTPGNITMIPEPGTLALLVCGLAGLLCYAWRRKR